jgi:hypothetical protein
MKATDALGLAALAGLLIVPSVMARPTNIPKTKALAVAEAICKGVENGIGLTDSVDSAYKEFATLPEANGALAEEVVALSYKLCAKAIMQAPE